MSISTIATMIGELAVIIGVISPIIVTLIKVSKGTKCQLRSEMLRIYYHNQKAEKIRQYEYENFVMLYEAYKALKGNSFVDKIYKEVKEWEVVT